MTTENDIEQDLEVTEMEPELLAADVAALLAEQEDTAAINPVQIESPSDLTEEALVGVSGAEVKRTSANDVHMTLVADQTFDDDKREDVFEQTYDLPIGPEHVPVTLEDKAQFVLSTLEDKHLFLDVQLMGKYTVTVRDLTPYEEDLVLDAVKYYSAAHEFMTPALQPSYAQQFRMAMQITAINGKELEYKSYTCCKEISREEQAKDLADYSMYWLGNMTAGRYSMCMKAAMVFHHKMKSLCEHQLNNVFWDPASIS